MNDDEVSIRITLRLNDEWRRHQTDEDLTEYLKARLESSLGFRGEIKRLTLRPRRARQPANP